LYNEDYGVAGLGKSQTRLGLQLEDGFRHSSLVYDFGLQRIFHKLINDKTWYSLPFRAKKQ